MNMKEKLVKQTDEAAWSKGLPVAVKYNEKAVQGTMAGATSRGGIYPA